MLRAPVLWHPDVPTPALLPCALTPRRALPALHPLKGFTNCRFMCHIQLLFLIGRTPQPALDPRQSAAGLQIHRQRTCANASEGPLSNLPSPPTPVCRWPAAGPRPGGSAPSLTPRRCGKL